MPTLRALKEWVDYQISQGKESLHTNHPVIIEEEQAKKAKNAPDEEGRRKTRIAWDAVDPQMFADFHAEKERYFRLVGGNPTVGTDLMIKALNHFTNEEIRSFLEDSQ